MVHLHVASHLMLQQTNPYRDENDPRAPTQPWLPINLYTAEHAGQWRCQTKLSLWGEFGRGSDTWKISR